jgi:gas vesicle protein
MSEHNEARRDYSFVIGLLMGTVVGAGVTMWLAPRVAAEVRDRMSDSARALRERASEHVQQAGSRVGEAVDELTRAGQGAREQVADAVARGAHQVERFATAVRS